MEKVSMARPDCHERALDVDTCEVLQLIAAGLGAGAIAARRGCGPDAVRRHLATAIRVMGVHSVPAAVDAAIRVGLIEPSC